MQTFLNYLSVKQTNKKTLFEIQYNKDSEVSFFTLKTKYHFTYLTYPASKNCCCFFCILTFLIELNLIIRNFESQIMNE
jgi:hypothetical protein